METLSPETPGSWLSEDHGWSSQAALPLADLRARDGERSRDVSPGPRAAKVKFIHQQLPKLSSMHRALALGKSLARGRGRHSHPSSTAAPAGQEQQPGCSGNEQIILCSCVAPAGAKSCSEPASGTWVRSHGVRRMWCGTQMVTWPLPVFFLQPCLSLSDSSPVTWPLRTPEL